MIIGNKNFDTENKIYIMGILNITPDSFSDAGKFNTIDKAIFHVEEMIKDGADIIDIGGESTRPGYTSISDFEEINRIIPIIKKIKKNFDIPISVDTYKSKVAEAALCEGVEMVNDIWGFKADLDMANIVKKYKASCCLMHNRNQNENPYNIFFDDVKNDLKQSVDIALNAGIEKDRIIIDPGIGFGKNYNQNIEIIQNINSFLDIGFPVMMAVSRKSVIGITLNLPVEQRLEGTLALTVIGIMKKCSFVRVHDVKENKRVINMVEKIIRRH